MLHSIYQNKRYAIVIIMTIAFFVRFIKLDSKPIHFDEISTIGCTHGIPYAGIYQVGVIKWSDIGFDKNTYSSKDFLKRQHPKHIFNAILYDNGSVLYFLSLSVWVKLLGNNIIIYRLFSLIFSCLTVYILFLFVSRLTQSNKLAFFSSLLLAIHPIAIASGQFCRSHAMAGFFVMLSTYVFYKIISIENEANYKNLIAYSLITVAALLSHYLVVYIFIGHFVIVLILERNLVIYKKFFLSYIISGILFSGWLICGGLEGLKINSLVDKSFAMFAQSWKPGDNPFFIPATFTSIMGSILQVLNKLMANSLQNYGFRISRISIFIIIPIGTIFLYLFNSVRSRKNFRLILFATVPLICYFIWNIALALKQGYLIIFQPHYAQYIIPYICILLVVSIEYIMGKYKNLDILAVLYLCIFMMFPFFLNSSGTEKIPYHKLAYKLIPNKNNTVNCKSLADAFYLSLGIKHQNDILLTIDTAMTANYSTVLNTGEILYLNNK